MEPEYNLKGQGQARLRSVLRLLSTRHVCRTLMTCNMTEPSYACETTHDYVIASSYDCNF